MSDLLYARTQMRRAVESPSLAADCAQRALDALDRIVERQRNEALEFLDDWVEGGIGGKEAILGDVTLVECAERLRELGFDHEFAEDDDFKKIAEEALQGSGLSLRRDALKPRDLLIAFNSLSAEDKAEFLALAKEKQ